MANYNGNIDYGYNAGNTANPYLQLDDAGQPQGGRTLSAIENDILAMFNPSYPDNLGNFISVNEGFAPDTGGNYSGFNVFQDETFDGSSATQNAAASVNTQHRGRQQHETITDTRADHQGTNNINSTAPAYDTTTVDNPQLVFPTDPNLIFDDWGGMYGLPTDFHEDSGLFLDENTQNGQYDFCGGTFENNIAQNSDFLTSTPPYTGFGVEENVQIGSMAPVIDNVNYNFNGQYDTSTLLDVNSQVGSSSSRHHPSPATRNGDGTYKAPTLPNTNHHKSVQDGSAFRGNNPPLAQNIGGTSAGQYVQHKNVQAIPKPHNIAAPVTQNINSADNRQKKAPALPKVQRKPKKPSKPKAKAAKETPVNIETNPPIPPQHIEQPRNPLQAHQMALIMKGLFQQMIPQAPLVPQANPSSDAQTDHPLPTIPGDLEDLDLPFDPRTVSVADLSNTDMNLLNALWTTFAPLIEQYQYQPGIALPSFPADTETPYPTFVGHFTDAKSAKKHRTSLREKPKEAIDLNRVKRHGRLFWVKRIYESMIDRSNIIDKDKSIHRSRFYKYHSETKKKRKDTYFVPKDIEAAAHHVFDAAIKVHEKGSWTKPRIYYKKPKRGALVDESGNRIETRLENICDLLRCSKAAVDDAIRGGITLALLVDNPTARRATKVSNNKGNEVRGERLNEQKRLKKEQVDKEREAAGLPPVQDNEVPVEANVEAHATADVPAEVDEELELDLEDEELEDENELELLLEEEQGFDDEGSSDEEVE